MYECFNEHLAQDNVVVTAFVKKLLYSIDLHR